jgi:hypothetical protein
MRGRAAGAKPPSSTGDLLPFRRGEQVYEKPVSRTRTIENMSTVKNPREKKEMSLKLDRRNTYGENSKASREAIPRGKQRQHMNERRSVGQALRPLRGEVHEDDAADAELAAKTRVKKSKLKGFKKQPDVPLGVVLDTKKSGRPKWAAPRPLP